MDNTVWPLGTSFSIRWATGEEEAWRVIPDHVDSYEQVEAMTVSHASPLGQCLLSILPGIASYKAPGGEQSFELLKVELPEEEDGRSAVDKLLRKLNPHQRLDLEDLRNRLREGAVLERFEVQRLENERQFSLLGHYYESRYRHDGDPWNIINASKYWRDAKLPTRALKVTVNITSEDSRCQAALWTTRGAALKDIQQFEGAIKYADMAVDLRPDSYYAHNLKGAALMALGSIDEAVNEFERAAELGARRKDLEKSLKQAPEGPERKIILEFLRSTPAVDAKALAELRQKLKA